MKASQDPSDCANPAGEEGAEPVATLNRTPLKSYRPKPGGSLLMAGMIGLATGMGLDEQRDDTEIAIPFESDEDGMNFDFGKLPPL